MNLRIELRRRKSNRLSMLEEFKMRGTLTTKDLMRYGPGMSSRIKELKKDGYIIIATYLRPGMWEYAYHGHEDEVKEYADSY